MHGLPIKMRFRESRLYISVIPPIVIGFFVGVLSAIMGIGGGFVIVPAMIYLLRMPTNVVMGTSLFQIIIVTAATTVLQATSNYRRRHRAGASSSSSAAWSARNSACAPASGCAANSCGCCWRCWCWRWPFGCSSAWSSSRAISSASRRWRHEARAALMLGVLALCAVPAQAAEDLVSGLSQDTVEITSNYTGTDIVVFGAIEHPRGQRHATMSSSSCAVRTPT